MQFLSKHCSDNVTENELNGSSAAADEGPSPGQKLVGMRVQCEWEGVSFEGKVVEYREAQQQYKVYYDADNSKAWHRWSELEPLQSESSLNNVASTDVASHPPDTVQGPHNDAERASKRRRSQRHLQHESTHYIPRGGCHNSLPVGRVACIKHEALRLSGILEDDPGAIASD